MGGYPYQSIPSHPSMQHTKKMGAGKVLEGPFKHCIQRTHTGFMAGLMIWKLECTSHKTFNNTGLS